MNKYYITTAIPYANADPHIGFALEILYADAMARYQRLLGNEVYFLTGTDEHGQKMLKTAKEAGRAVADFAAEISAKYLSLADQWNISNDDFIRTTEERHMERAQKFWEASAKKGDIYMKEYSGFYCVGCESFKTEKDLVNGLCPDHQKAPEIVTEKNYFFRLSNYQKNLEKLFTERPDFVYPESKRNEMINILKNGLEDISISRAKEKLPWGVPVPGDDSQVMYVWFDALTNYVTALDYGSKDNKLFKKFWPADAHVIGKEINRFHSLLWPAMLMSAGLEVPKQIAVHGWITVDGQKMSKTIGNVIDPLKLTNDYPLDGVRYFLMSEIPFDNDGDFSHAKFKEKYNADLANGIGNLTSRILTMVEKYCDGKVPASKKVNLKLKDAVSLGWSNYQPAINSFKFGEALQAITDIINCADGLITERQPWTLAKEGKMEEVNDLLASLTEALRHICILLWPIMPDTSEKILERLELDPAKELAKSVKTLEKWGSTLADNKVTKGEALFPRLV